MADHLISTVSQIVSDNTAILSASDLREMVNAADGDGNPALHWAARKGHQAVAVQLIEAGAMVDARNKELSTALHWAARVMLPRHLVPGSSG